MAVCGRQARWNIPAGHPHGWSVLVWLIRNPGNAGCSMPRQIFATNCTCAIRHLAQAGFTTRHKPCFLVPNSANPCVIAKDKGVRHRRIFLGAFTAASSAMPDRHCGRVEDRAIMTVRR